MTVAGGSGHAGGRHARPARRPPAANPAANPAAGRDPTAQGPAAHGPTTGGPSAGGPVAAQRRVSAGWPHAEPRPPDGIGPRVPTGPRPHLMPVTHPPRPAREVGPEPPNPSPEPDASGNPAEQRFLGEMDPAASERMWNWLANPLPDPPPPLPHRVWSWWRRQTPSRPEPAELARRGVSDSRRRPALPRDHAGPASLGGTSVPASQKGNGSAAARRAVPARPRAALKATQAGIVPAAQAGGGRSARPAGRAVEGASLLAAGILAALARRVPNAPMAWFRGRREALVLAADVGAARFLDRATRLLSAELAARGRPLPPVYAATLTDNALILHLAPAPAEPPPAPWRKAGTARSWRIDRLPDTPDGLPPSLVATIPAGTPAPFPGLVTVGFTGEGARVLVDVEGAPGTIAIAGDPARTSEIARSIAIELATSTWSDDVRVTLVGFEDDPSPVAPDRLRLVTSVEQALADLASRHPRPGAAVAGTHTDWPGAPSGRVLHGRQQARTQALWTPDLLILARPPDDDAAELLARYARGRDQAVGVLVAGETAAARWVFTATRDGRLSLGVLGLEVRAQRLSAGACASIVELFRSPESAAGPPDPADRAAETAWPPGYRPADVPVPGPGVGVERGRLASAGYAGPAPSDSRLLAAGPPPAPWTASGAFPPPASEPTAPLVPFLPTLPDTDSTASRVVDVRWPLAAGGPAPGWPAGPGIPQDTATPPAPGAPPPPPMASMVPPAPLPPTPPWPTRPEPTPPSALPMPAGPGPAGPHMPPGPTIMGEGPPSVAPAEPPAEPPAPSGSAATQPIRPPDAATRTVPGAGAPAAAPPTRFPSGGGPAARGPISILVPGATRWPPPQDDAPTRTPAHPPSAQPPSAAGPASPSQLPWAVASPGMPTGSQPDPHDPPPDAEVRVLGRPAVSVAGWVPADQVDELTELVVYLALGPAAPPMHALVAAIWPGGARAEVVGDALRRAQAWLGEDPRGRPRLYPGSDGGPRLDPGVRCDWRLFAASARRALPLFDAVNRRQPGQPQPVDARLTGRASGELLADAAANLAAALRLVTGPVLTDLPAWRYGWLLASGLDVRIRTAVVDVAHRLAALSLATGDTATAMAACRTGLRAVPAAEPLWRDLLRTVAARGDRRAVEAVAAEMYRALPPALEPGQGDPSAPGRRRIQAAAESETNELVQTLLPGYRPRDAR